MGVEKKITITGVDSVQIDYEFAAGSYTAPGAFRFDDETENGEKDYVKSRKITEVIVHNKDDLLLADVSVGTEKAWVELVLAGSSIVISDYTDGNDARIYINYPRIGYRGRGAGLYHPTAEISAVKINNVAVVGWDGKGTVEILYKEKMPTAQLQLD